MKQSEGVRVDRKVRYPYLLFDELLDGKRTENPVHKALRVVLPRPHVLTRARVRCYSFRQVCSGQEKLKTQGTDRLVKPLACVGFIVDLSLSVQDPSLRVVRDNPSNDGRYDG